MARRRALRTDPVIDLGDPAPGPHWILLIVIAILICLALMLSGCTSTFHGVTQRPEAYGGGYLVVGECCEQARCEPCMWLCSPAIGGNYACGRVPWEDWGQ